MGAARPFRQAGEMWFQEDSKVRRRTETRNAPSPPTRSAVAEPGRPAARLALDDRLRRRARARVPGRGREAVSRSVRLDGADAPLRAAEPRLRRARVRSRDRAADRLPVQESEARRDRRLP